MNSLRVAFRTIFCLLVALVVLEMCSRADDVLSFGAPFWGKYDDQSLYVIDKIGKWGKPGARYERWQLNSLGYRGPELQPGTIRIVCFGASQTFGLYEGPDGEYPRQLEKKINGSLGAPIFQVVNAAFPGETLPTAALRVPQVVSQVHPSYALIYPALANYISIASKRRSSSDIDGSVPQSASAFDFRIANRVRNLLKRIVPEGVQTWLRQRQIDSETANIRVMERLPEESVDRFREDLMTLIVALKEHDVEPVLITEATTFGATPSSRDRELLTAWRKFYPSLKESGFVDMENRMNYAIRDIARRENLLLIDAAVEIPHGPKYFADFVHFTSAGAEAMAATLAEGLKPLIVSERKTSIRRAVAGRVSINRAVNH
jgi:lysophospholipase L1-like esterase